MNNVIVFHIVSGQAFFSGIALVIIAAVASMRSRPIVKRISVWALIVGLLAITVSSTPIPYWYYAIATTITLAWIVSQRNESWQRWAPSVMVAVWLVAAAFELPYHLTRPLSSASARHITIIGDSVTAGIRGDETSETWPSIIAREHVLQVQDISHMGETAESALKRAKKHRIESPIVVVEIGGNDILGTTSPAKFARDLDALLAHLSAENRQIVMFELPLPPFFHEYGRIQRAAASNYHVSLFPKRVFLSVLASHKGTLDSIHLSQSGHHQMADSVWKAIGTAFAADR